MAVLRMEELRSKELLKKELRKKNGAPFSRSTAGCSERD